MCNTSACIFLYGAGFFQKIYVLHGDVVWTVSVSTRLCPALDLYSTSNALHYLPINIIWFCHTTYYLMVFYILQCNYKYLLCANMQNCAMDMYF
jgi:hypothetical protein